MRLIWDLFFGNETSQLAASITSVGGQGLICKDHLIAWQLIASHQDSFTRNRQNFMAVYSISSLGRHGTIANARHQFAVVTNQIWY